jgi:hypothetical protein
LFRDDNRLGPIRAVRARGCSGRAAVCVTRVRVAASLRVSPSHRGVGVRRP